MKNWLSMRVLVLLAFTGVGCGDDGGGACSTPNLTGSPGLATGTASAHGSGMLLAGPPDGYELELLIDDGGLAEGVYPEGLYRIPTVCGSAFTYQITNLAAGTYNLVYEVYDPSSASVDPAYTATSTNQLTVTDGASVEFNPIF